MHIERTENEMNGTWTITDGEKEIGKMQYNWLNASKFNIFHTEVDKEYAGKGYGKELLETAVKYARDNQKKITATCTYAKKIFEKDASYNDVYETN